MHLYSVQGRPHEEKDLRNEKKKSTWLLILATRGRGT